MNVNFEAVGNVCTVSVAMEITGPNGFKVNASKNGAPYTIFGNNGADYSGRQLQIGTYTVSAVPNNFPTKMKQVTVTVQNC
jgi:flagellar hook assembly protein FlgD